MRAAELRSTFVDFFVERDHVQVDSASLIPHDPSLLFTVAGMVPFKPYFVGEQVAPWPRAVSVQKCVRAGGKHNDLDEIGRTSRHLSFFEMLGNFSFGDYFKERAIPLAWEFVTEVLKLDPDRLWVTVHHSDDEAAEIWRTVVGVPAQRIQRLGEDNYWKMGDLGPCGPCSEIFWDKGPEYGPDGGPEHGGEDRFIEIWNLVFMQFDQLPDGSKVELPAPSIDTGAGLERILSVLQDVDSVWELDEIRSLVALAETCSSVRYGASERTDVSLRILAEHARTTAFLISDGVIPSNEDRGYVLRRIMRRAIRHGYLLGVQSIILVPLIERVIEIMGADYPDLVSNRDLIVEIAEREELGFRNTLVHGLAILENELSTLNPGEALSGATAFQLHDTFGFPYELTSEIAAERSIELDQEGFEREMQAQRSRAKAARKSVKTDSHTPGFAALLEAHGSTVFVGRELPEVNATVLGVFDDLVVLDTTPFYAESGGQIGDTGTLKVGAEAVEVIDTTYGLPGLVVHRIATEGPAIEVGHSVQACIDVERRNAIRRHHTVTHLAHWALREVLGSHVKQQGSWVGPDRLRFDFSHYGAMTSDEIERVEDLVNTDILSNAVCRNYETTKAQAMERGALAFFGDKYGDTVRVLEAGPHSVELCGGTHVDALGDIGLFKIVSESSIGSNIRRVEAVAGAGPITRIRELQRQLNAAADALGVGVDDLAGAARKRTDDLKSLRAELKTLKSQLAGSGAAALLAQADNGDLVAAVDIETRDDLRDLALSLRDQHHLSVVVLFGSPGGKGVAGVAAVTAESGLNAGAILSPCLALVGGGGGKGDLIATAGGRNADGIPAALDRAREIIRSLRTS